MKGGKIDREKWRERILENVEMDKRFYLPSYFRDMLSEIATSFWKDNWREQGEKMERKKMQKKNDKLNKLRNFIFFPFKNTISRLSY